MLLALIAIPAALAALALVVPSPRLRPWLVPLGALAHAIVTARVVGAAAPPALGGWLAVDPLSRVFLGFVALQFLVCSLYVPGYLAARHDRPNRLFCAALLVLLAAITLCVLAQHFGLMWVAIETTTLSSAPLVYFARNARSLEAMWKYLLVGSVGIALALFGSFFLAYSALHAGLGSSLAFPDLVAQAPALSKPWLHAAFVMLVVGYGTKMGLAPMHTWKPDAYGEAPGVVAALLAGAVTSCAFLAILRFVKICHAAGDGAYAQELLIALGLASMIVGAVFVVRQRDLKRMLAYSSVEHMGILVLAIGVGGVATFGAMLHLVANGLGKGAVFLAAGNLQRSYRSKSIDDVRGAIRRVPWSAWLFLLGFFAITAAPPSALFTSELAIVRGAFGQGHPVIGGLFLAILVVVFLGMGANVTRAVLGEPPPGEPAPRESFAMIAPIVVFLVLVVALGLWLPRPIGDAFADAAAYLEARP